MGADMTVCKTDDGGNILHFAVECASHFKVKWELTKDTSQCLRELLKASRLLIDQPDDNGMKIFFLLFCPMRCTKFYH